MFANFGILLTFQFFTVDALRSAICGTEDELSRFRKLAVNSVMATDIVDKELKQLRNERW